MRAPHLLAIALPLALGCATVAGASSLRVAPATIELPADARAATLTLRNDGAVPANYQIRVFGWSQEGGTERLEQTDDVVASPPITSVGPGVDYIVRIVRLSRRPVISEESYRVIVDELPDGGTGRNGTVTFLVRYSIPVFFTPAGSSRTGLAWRLGLDGGDLVLNASNPGPRRIRVANLALSDAVGRTVALADGLAGYVLAGAVRVWRFDRRRIDGLAPGPAHLRYRTGQDSFDAPVELPGRG